MDKKRNNRQEKKNNIEIIFEDEENVEDSSDYIKKAQGKRTSRKSRMGTDKNKYKNNKTNSTNKNGKKDKKKMPRKKKIIIALSIILGIFLLLGIVFGVYLFKAKGNVKEAVLNIATDIVGDQDPIFVLVLGVSEDISAKLTDTIILCGYNPSTQKAFMLSVPRDTFVGKSEASASGYDKINAQFQKSAEKTVESVELLTGIDIDYYVIVRNISITSIFECFGSIDFDVPIDMDYDDPTQDLHIHLKKGYQTLQPNQIEQLLRFRHNNDGTSYPSSYGDNDYGRMRTQREFIKAAMEQVLSIQNVGKLKDLASMVYTNLQTNMSGYTLLDYVPHGLKFSTSNLRSEQLPGQSAMINNLWFYKVSKSQTKALVDELMIYLELDDETLDSHYKYASDIKGVKPDENWVANEVVIDDDYDTTTNNKNTDDEEEDVDPNNCKHQYAVYDDSDEASCEKTGTVVYKCIKCKKEYQKQTEALGHNYVNGVCTRCGKEDPSYKKPTNNNDKTNTTDEDTNTQHTTHNYVEVSRTKATCTENGVITKKCTDCDKTTTETLKATGHSFGDWVTVTEATTTSEGLKKRKCSSCDKEETQSIPKITPPPSDDKDPSAPDNENSGNSSSSGDEEKDETTPDSATNPASGT